MRSQTKQAIRDVGRRFGLEVRLNGLNSRDDLRFIHFLRMHGIDTVLDVGANRGQFAQQLFNNGFEGRVISFEPLPDEHALLIEAAAAFGDRWSVAPRLALGDKAGKATFYVTHGSASSSLLEPLGGFVEAAPQVKVDKQIEVETQRLDALWPNLDLTGRNVFLKIDVQGSEALVLGGASAILPYIKGVLVELSLVDLYAGQPSGIALQQWMAEQGFGLWDIWTGFRNPQTHRLNQIDALFFRDGHGTIGEAAQ
ncbi:MAG: FkbM family methyltransferase [Mesorhizobium sp.]|uniref:FkbM family methyltransferase n=1 Tax=unclassified Mesorhizobium TaxID=325217 RepID=UPI000FCBA129|nr:MULTISPECIES: FkbM family methyltransferase [unclassified Mesorhizobium]RUV70442.1 FkbM family methyltransferase [Mesorhizobium sp. M5C.F.Cr.IN.023.01.1.1]RWF87882.1 MAG: FkbM family methyltransferase [Mesorhizobium sp.]RWF96855.1 MAG: FkbM family methyltransferase [Mesorhizobium sp.]RWI41785.1 MAG: FkbM family methyltransferase [Mesorhizobium sp.]RWI50946.1 MAG: FkbM family methyltransferase [Mesorhizobium sp.]